MVRFGLSLGAIALSFMLSASQSAFAGSPPFEQSYEQLFKNNANAKARPQRLDRVLPG